MKNSLRGRLLNVAEDLRALRERAGLSRTKLAKLAGYGYGTTLQRYEDPEYMKGRGLSAEMCARLEIALAGKGQPPISKSEIWALCEPGAALVVSPIASISVPVVSWESLRNGAEMLTKLKADEHVQVTGLSPGEYLAARVEDDHCETEAPVGAYVVLDLMDREPRSGKIFAVMIDGALVLRRYIPNPERWESLAARPEAAVYPTQASPIVGRLIRTIKEH